MKIQHLLVAILLLASTVTAARGTFEKVINDKIDPEAKCLDGSPPAIFIQEGEKDKILLFTSAGAACAGFGTNIDETLD